MDGADFAASPELVDIFEYNDATLIRAEEIIQRISTTKSF
jgi:hypothetical protein